MTPFVKDGTDLIAELDDFEVVVEQFGQANTGRGLARTIAEAGGVKSGAVTGAVEQPDSASVKARAASGEAFDFTCMLQGLGLTGGFFDGQAFFQGVATGLGFLKSRQRGFGCLGFEGRVVVLQLGQCGVAVRLGQAMAERITTATGRKGSDGCQHQGGQQGVQSGGDDGRAKHGEPSDGCGACVPDAWRREHPRRTPDGSKVPGRCRAGTRSAARTA